MDRNYLLIFVCALLLISSAQGVTFSLQEVEAAYRPGDTLQIIANLENYYNSSVNIQTDCAIVGDSPTAPMIVATRYIELDPREKTETTLYEQKVTEDFLPGAYTISCALIVNDIPEEEIIRTFLVEGTPRELYYEVHLSRDRNRSQETLVFLRGETVYVGYFSSTDDISVKGNIHPPDGRVKEITLPTEIEVEDMGTYILDLVGSKQGYRKQELRVEFAVIEEEPSIVGDLPRATAPPITTQSPPPTTMQSPPPSPTPVSMSVIALALILVFSLNRKL